MKVFFCLITINLLSVLLYGQKMAATFKDAIASGVSIEKLDENYQSALHSDSAKSAFKGQEKEFYEGYVSLLTELDKYLKKNNFSWNKKTRCFNRIYMNQSGGIDYFLFNFSPGEIEPQMQQEFQRLLGQFIQVYKFPLTNKSKFAQCSPVTYGAK